MTLENVIKLPFQNKKKHIVVCSKLYIFIKRPEKLLYKASVYEFSVFLYAYDTYAILRKWKHKTLFIGLQFALFPLTTLTIAISVYTSIYSYQELHDF